MRKKARTLIQEPTVIEAKNDAVDPEQKKLLSDKLLPYMTGASTLNPCFYFCAIKIL